jgi:CheY-like chemotaxis protein
MLPARKPRRGTPWPNTTPSRRELRHDPGSTHHRLTSGWAQVPKVHFREAGAQRLFLERYPVASVPTRGGSTILTGPVYPPLWSCRHDLAGAPWTASLNQDVRLERGVTRYEILRGGSVFAGNGGEGEVAGRVANLILVVDDNPAFRDIASRIFSDWGHNVVHAGTAAEALSLTNEVRPDTVLVDIGLPDGDGFALTELLVEMTWPIRIILVSTDSDAGNASAAERAGAIGFFPKDELLSGDLRDLIENG